METFNIKFTAHLSENHQLQAADALIASQKETISKLRQELAAANEYIAELEEGQSPKIKELTALNEMLRKEVKALQSKFYEGTFELDKEARVVKLLEDRRALKEENEKLLNTRDHLLYLLNKKAEQ